jgi:hypothetical protein
MNMPPTLPAVTEIPSRGRCPYLGIGRSRIYALAQLDKNIIIRLGGRSVVDVARILELIASMPRGPRKQSAPGRSAPRNIAAKERAKK